MKSEDCCDNEEVDRGHRAETGNGWGSQETFRGWMRTREEGWREARGPEQCPEQHVLQPARAWPPWPVLKDLLTAYELQVSAEHNA